MLSTMTVTETLHRLRTALPTLRAQFGVLRIGIFGSVARGEAGPDSDTDILVDLAYPVSYFELLRLQDAVSACLGRRADVHTRAGLRDHIRAAAERDLIVA